MRIGGLARNRDCGPAGRRAPGRAGRVHPEGGRPGGPGGAPGRAAAGRVRAEVAALPLFVLAACAFRAKSFVTGVGADEFSLLLMAERVRDGLFPYEGYWDVRPPLAYLFGLPSTFTPDSVRSVAALRLLALLAHAAAAWTFFCLFCRTLGIRAAAVGALVLLASASTTSLHFVVVPNHFTMALSLLAFAGVVEGLRRGSRALWFASALAAGLLPWVMVHTAPVALSLAVLAGLGGRGRGRGRRWGGWLALAALPSLAVVGSYFLWGPFEVFVRTVFLAPFGVMGGTPASGYRFFSPEEMLRVLRSAPWAPLHVLVLVAGAALLPGAIRRAPPGTALRASAFLALPLAAAFLAAAAAKPPAPPEYWIDAAPVAALLAAAATAGVLGWPGWAAPGLSRHVRPPVLRACLTLCLGAALILPIDPWKKAPKPPLPGREYCDAVARWAGRVGPRETLLDLNGLCGFQVLDSGATLHPPFAFVHQWFRQLRHAWIGKALAGDGSEAASAARLVRALAPGSGVGVILSDRRLAREVRGRGREESFFREWRRVWFRRVEGRDDEDRLSSLGILVRRNAFLRAGRPWPPAPSRRPAGGSGAASDRDAGSGRGAAAGNGGAPSDDLSGSAPDRHAAADGPAARAEGPVESGYPRGMAALRPSASPS